MITKVKVICPDCNSFIKETSCGGSGTCRSCGANVRWDTNGNATVTKRKSK